MTSKSETKDTIENIRLTARDIEATKRKLKVVNEQIEAILEDMDEAEEVVKAQEALADAKQKLASALMGRGNYNDLMENAGEIKQTLKDQKEILSLHLVAYYQLSNGERQVEIDDYGNAREVILKGTLGAEGKYQTSLLTGGSDV